MDRAAIFTNSARPAIDCAAEMSPLTASSKACLPLLNDVLASTCFRTMLPDRLGLPMPAHYYTVHGTLHTHANNTNTICQDKKGSVAGRLYHVTCAARVPIHATYMHGRAAACSTTRRATQAWGAMCRRRRVVVCSKQSRAAAQLTLFNIKVLIGDERRGLLLDALVLTQFIPSTSIIVARHGGDGGVVERRGKGFF